MMDTREPLSASEYAEFSAAVLSGIHARLVPVNTRLDEVLARARAKCISERAAKPDPAVRAHPSTVRQSFRQQPQGPNQ